MASSTQATGLKNLGSLIYNSKQHYPLYDYQHFAYMNKLLIDEGCPIQDYTPLAITINPCYTKVTGILAVIEALRNYLKKCKTKVVMYLIEENWGKKGPKDHLHGFLFVSNNKVDICVKRINDFIGRKLGYHKIKEINDFQGWLAYCNKHQLTVYSEAYKTWQEQHSAKPAIRMEPSPSLTR